jgi:hypothetical protein
MGAEVRVKTGGYTIPAHKSQELFFLVGSGLPAGWLF